MLIFIISYFFGVLYALIKQWIFLIKKYKVYFSIKKDFFKFYIYIFICIIILFDCILFIKYYIKFLYNIFLLYFLIKNNNYILNYLTFFNKYNCILKSQIYLSYYKKYKKLIIECKNNKLIFSVLFLELYFKNYFYYNFYYCYYAFIYIYSNVKNILIEFLLDLENFFIIKWRNFYNKDKTNSFNFYDYIERFKFWKKDYYIKMTLNFLYYKNKRLVITFYYNFISKLKKLYFYFRYIIISILDIIFFSLFKNQGNLVIYHCFKLLKFIKLFKQSYIKYIIESDIIYIWLKKIERKKWYIQEIHQYYNEKEKNKKN